MFLSLLGLLILFLPYILQLQMIWVWNYFEKAPQFSIPILTGRRITVLFQPGTLQHFTMGINELMNTFNSLCVNEVPSALGRRAP